MSTIGEKTFLVFSGGNDRAVLGFLRALRVCGKRACIVARTHSDKVLRTGFRKDVRWIRDNDALDMGVFTDCINRVRKYIGDRTLVVLPSTEFFNEFLLQHRNEIGDLGCEIPLVDEPTYALLTDKRSATDFFSAAGFSIPKEYATPDIVEPPVVAKPLHNVSQDGRSLYPQLLVTCSELEAFRATYCSEDYFFQEYVEGQSLYLLLYLSRDGRGDQKWSQRNILQQPGGKSMLLAEPADFHRSPEAKRIIELLRTVGFRGLGMIEIIQASDRRVFIEMNPRIWGPVQFCLDQHEPLLQAFIGDALCDDPLHFTTFTPSGRLERGKYCWLGGLADTLASGQRPTWHTTKRSVVGVTIAGLRYDIYLRADSWRCFLYELILALKMALHRERIKR